MPPSSSDASKRPSADAHAREGLRHGLETQWHLATTPLEAVTTELEWTLIRWQEAYSRYTRQALNMQGLTTMSVQEMEILNIVRLHDRPKPAGMIAHLLNRDDIQNVQYGLRKLLKLKFIQKVKDGAGKNFNLAVTETGRRVCDESARIRRQLLVEQVKQLENGEETLQRAAKVVSMFTGLYDEAGRISVSTGGRPLLSESSNA